MRTITRLRRKPRRPEVARAVVEQREPDLGSAAASPLERALFLQRAIGNRGVRALIEAGAFNDAFNDKSRVRSPAESVGTHPYTLRGQQTNGSVRRRIGGAAQNAAVQFGAPIDRIAAMDRTEGGKAISGTGFSNISRKTRPQSVRAPTLASLASESSSERSNRQPFVADSAPDRGLSQPSANQAEGRKSHA